MLDEIEAFLAVMNYGSISLAAEKLFVTQPALSRKIKALEESLGYRLLTRGRGSRSLELTDCGRAFLSIARRDRQLWDEARAIPRLLDRSYLRVAVVTSVACYVLPAALRAYLREDPSLQIRITHCHHYEAADHLFSGVADVGLVSPDIRSGRLESRLLYASPMVCVTAAQAGYGGSVSPEELDPEREIRIPWNRDCDSWHEIHFSAGSKPLISVDTVDMLESFLSGSNWAVAPAAAAQRFARHGARLSRLSPAPADQQVYCLTRPGGGGPACARLLRHIARVVAHIPSVISYMDEDCIHQ